MPDRIAIITGAGTGIGRAASLALAQDGFSIVLAGRRREPLETTAQEIQRLDRATLVVPTDISIPDQVKTLFAKTKERFGRLDLLFNNAGFGAGGPIEDLPLERWKAVVDTNLTGTFLCTQEAIKIMKDQKPMGGRIINNGSISAHAPRPGSIAYTSTKHAITGLTKSTSLDCRKYDITCGQIDIGNAATAGTERMAQGIIQPNGTTMVEPRMDVNHVGRAIVFMANLPPDENVQFMTIMAAKMPFIGRG
ncbi:MAG TPA: SDR family oxidoreductase [Stellaceae bacterium]|nr:SDR family oxidoreductase [Stellaceae bacterium]